MRRKVNAERRSTRRSAQIVTGISVGLALALALFNQGYVQAYGSLLGQLVLVVVVALYGAGFFWMRKLATFKKAERLLAGPAPQARTEQQPEPVGAARGRS
jgi:Flp pilus assembly protein TadB